MFLLLLGETITNSLCLMGQRGDLCFSMAYNHQREQYLLTLHKAVNLYPMDFNGTSDPYVKIWMYTEDRRVKKGRSIIYENTLNITFKDEPFVFPCPINDIPVTHFEIDVMDYDRFGGNDLIGRIVLGGKQGLNVEREKEYITLMKTIPLFRGEISLSLQFKRSYLKVILYEAKDLLAKDLNGLSDPYVKMCLYKHQERIMKQKSRIHKKTLNPVFKDEVFVFPMMIKQPREYHLKVLMKDWDRFGGHDLIGMVVLGTTGSDKEKEHWLKAFITGEQIEYTHKLKAVGRGE